MNLAHLQLFLNKIKKAQATNQKQVSLTITEAISIQSDIAALLLELQKESSSKAPVQTDVSGGSF